MRPLGFVTTTIEPKSRANPVLRLRLLLESTERLLGFVPATIEPKSHAIAALQLRLPLTSIDDYFLLNGRMRKRACSLDFFTQCLGCAAGLSENSPWKCPEKRSCLLSSPSAHKSSMSTIVIDVRSSAFDFGGKY